jgi:hypothetical protein
MPSTMDARQVQWVERAIDVAAAAVVGGAAAYAAVRVGLSAVVDSAIASATFLGAWTSLSRIKAEPPTFTLERFEAPLLPDAPDGDELLLTDADRLGLPDAVRGDNELVLDDVLAELGDHSRVVRLFDPSAMPTPAGLQARIDRHLDDRDPTAAPDASQALHDALADLRRSLR